MKKQYYISKEDFQVLKKSWKILSDTKSITARDILIYNILRGKEPVRGFVGVKNPLHITANNSWYAFKQAKYYAAYMIDRGNETFKKLYGIDIPENLLSKIRESKYE